MRQLLNTLYVTTQGAYLAKDGETVSVSIEHEVRLRVPIHTLDGIVCFGQVTCSPFLVGFCAERGVGVTFLTEYGRFLARVQGPVSGNVLLRREQYRWADDPTRAFGIARSVVLAKMANCRVAVLRAQREMGECETQETLRRACNRLARILEVAERETDLDRLRGHEGDAAQVYFSVFDCIFRAMPIAIPGRSR